MYCENCGALRQAGDAFCVSCGTSLGAAGRPQGGAQRSLVYADTTAVATPDNALGVRLASIACWLAFASCAFWLLGAGDRLVYRHGEQFSWYLKSLNWWACIPLLVAACMLFARRNHLVTGVALVIGTSALLYWTALQLGVTFIEHLPARSFSGPLSLSLLSAVLAVAALCCVSIAVIQVKPKRSMPGTELAVAACLAGGFSTLSLVLSAGGRHFWSFDLVFFISFPVWIQLLVVAFAFAIIAAMLIGCLLGGRAAASVAITGAIYFGLLSIQRLFNQDLQRASGFYFGVLACGAFIATAVIASSIAKREMQPALLDPSLLAR